MFFASFCRKTSKPAFTLGLTLGVSRQKLASKKSIGTCSAFVWGLLLAFHYEPAQSGLQADQEQTDHLRSDNPRAIEAGGRLFNESCSVCHGIDGKGSARGPDLTQGLVVTRGTDQEVARVIRQGVPGSSMAAFALPDSQILELVALIRSLSTKAAQLSVKGDPGSGKQVFFGKARCSDCHMIRGQGGLLGPDLSNIGGERTLSEIREAIIKPTASSQRKRPSVMVVTQKGEKLSGALLNRDNFSLQMIDQKGQFRFFLSSQLHEVVPQERSVMPDNYQTLLSATEIQDLLAYLSRQTVAR